MTSPRPYEVPLRGPKAAGRVALVDAADADLVTSVRWNVAEQPRPGGGLAAPYAVGEIGVEPHWRVVRMHKLITDYGLTDHINHNTLDNQRHNLRDATPSGNAMNRLPRPGCSSRYKGVGWNRVSGKWMVRVQAEGVSYFLGQFTDEIEAALAYDAGARIHQGEYAFLNFPRETERAA